MWIWLVLLVAALAPALSRPVSGEIGARRSTGRGWAVFARPRAGRARFPALRRRRAASATAAFRAFLDFSAFPYWQFSPAEEDAIRVSVLDLRFGSPAQPRFEATARVARNGRVLESTFRYEPRR